MRTRVPESSRPGASPVKGWKRHLDGWQPGLLAVLIAGTSALIGVPRAVPPTELPEPAVRADELAAVMRADEARARALDEKRRSGALPGEVVALGSAVRDFGLVAADAMPRAPGRPRTAEDALRQIALAAKMAIDESPEDVLGLRAHQAIGFAREARRLERTSAPSESLVELGGDFREKAEAYRWYDPATLRLAPGDDVLRAFFKKRWNDLTGLHGAAFALSLDEKRALSRFFIAHPDTIHARPASTSPEVLRAQAIDDRVKDDEKRRERIQDLARFDPTYPAAFAEGVILFRLGRFEHAQIAFGNHLAKHPDGPWTLRARNHLKAAAEAR